MVDGAEDLPAFCIAVSTSSRSCIRARAVSGLGVEIFIVVFLLLSSMAANVRRRLFGRSFAPVRVMHLEYHYAC